MLKASVNGNDENDNDNDKIIYRNHRSEAKHDNVS